MKESHDFVFGGLLIVIKVKVLHFNNNDNLLVSKQKIILILFSSFDESELVFYFLLKFLHVKLRRKISFDVLKL